MLVVTVLSMKNQEFKLLVLYSDILLALFVFSCQDTALTKSSVLLDDKTFNFVIMPSNIQNEEFYFRNT